MLPVPHGDGSLKPLLLNEGALRATEFMRAQTLPRIGIGPHEAAHLLMLGLGAYTPLDGFMNEADWRSVCEHEQLASGLFWPLPVTLTLDAVVADMVEEGMDLALYDPGRDDITATMTVTEKFSFDATFECRWVFGTADPAHPGVRRVMEQGQVCLAGPVRLISDGGMPDGDGSDRFMSAPEVRALIQQRAWDRVIARYEAQPAATAADTLSPELIFTPRGWPPLSDARRLRTPWPLEPLQAGAREERLRRLCARNYGADWRANTA